MESTGIKAKQNKTLKCRFCKSQQGKLETLTRNQLKLVRHKMPSIQETDVFCKKCRDKIDFHLQRRRDKHKAKSTSSSSSVSSFLTIQAIDTTSASIRGIESPSSDSQTKLTTTNSRNDEMPPSLTNDIYDPTSQLDENPISTQSSSEGLVITPPVSNVNPVDAVDDTGSTDDENDPCEDIVPISHEVPGSDAISNVPPFIKRRRNPPRFPKDQNVPIYNRSNFGG